MDEMRKAVGRFGISGKTQTQPMAQLSDGLRSRVVFAWLVCAPCRAHRRLVVTESNHFMLGCRLVVLVFCAQACCHAGLTRGHGA